jgi:hypothetical protein
MIGEPQIQNLAKSFDDLFQDVRKYLTQLGEENYSEERYKWLRPRDLKDLEPASICEPYSLEELNQQGESYIEEPVRKDYSILDYEMSFLQSFARSFNERHTSRLRHFSHSAGVSDTINTPETGVLDQVYEVAKKILSAE